jgi:hypothetical protein
VKHILGMKSRIECRCLFGDRDQRLYAVRRESEASGEDTECDMNEIVACGQAFDRMQPKTHANFNTASSSIDSRLSNSLW